MLYSRWTEGDENTVTATPERQRGRQEGEDPAAH